MSLRVESDFQHKQLTNNPAAFLFALLALCLSPVVSVAQTAEPSPTPRAAEQRPLNPKLPTLFLIGDSTVRTIALRPTDGLVRGTPVKNTGSPIQVPVGEGVLGHGVEP